MATKPAIALARFATGVGAAVEDPTSGLRDSGFVGGTPIDEGNVNALLKQLYLWALYLDEGALAGNHSIAGALTVNGTLTVPTIGGSANFTGAVTMASTLGVTGFITATAGLTAAPNQHVTVSGTGRFQHGTRTIVVPVVAPFVSPPLISVLATVSGSGSASNIIYAPIVLDVGKRITAIRARVQDSTTGPTRVQVRIQSMTDGAQTLATLATSSPSSGLGTEQTIQATGLTIGVAASTIYYAVLNTQTGSAACSVFRCEVDYIDPGP